MMEVQSLTFKQMAETETGDTIQYQEVVEDGSPVVGVISMSKAALETRTETPILLKPSFS